MSSVVAIYITIPLLLIPQILLCGLVIKFDDLNTRASDENIVPLIGEVIPSRWAFEALMVEQFCDNAYNRPYFPIEKEKYLAQYYENVHLPEVRSLVEQIALKDDPDKRKTVENELAVLSRAARIAPRMEGGGISGISGQSGCRFARTGAQLHCLSRSNPAGTRPERRDRATDEDEESPS